MCINLHFWNISHVTQRTAFNDFINSSWFRTYNYVDYLLKKK